MQAREHDRRDWLIILIILLFGFLCILLAGGWALRFSPSWRLNTSMESRLDPNSNFLNSRPNGFFDPLDPAILTKPAWMNVFLTPGASVSTRTPAPTSINTLVPSTPTAKPSITASPTNTLAVRPSPTRTSVFVPPTKTPTSTPLPSVDLRITKSDGIVTYTAGSSITYTIRVSNPGGSNGVVNAIVTDNFSTNANIASANWTCSGMGGGTCMANGSGNINDNTVDLPVGASVTYLVNVNISAGATGALINTASVSVPAGYTDPVPGNNSATDVDTLFVPTSVDLGITKTDGSPTYSAYAGSNTVTYTIIVTNNGPNAVIGAVVTDFKPSQVTTWDWVCSEFNGASGCSPILTNADFTDTVNLPNGASIEYTVTANIAIGSTGDLINMASVSVPVGYNDPNNSNDSAIDTDTLFVPSVDLEVTKTDGVTSYVAGGSLTYTITVINNGPNNVTNATVTDTFPAQITSATWTCAGTGTCTANGSGDINDNTVDLLVGQFVTYTVNVNISAAATGNLDNTATVNVPAGYNDPVPANNSDTDTDTPASVDLQITKTDGVTSYIAGGNVTYTITVTNNGPDNVINAIVTDTFPAQITATWTCAGTGTCAAGGSGDINDNTVDLLVGQSVTYTVNATISPATTGALSNTATVSVPSGYTDPNAANNSATDTDAQASINLQITKTNGIGFTTYTPGSPVTPYTIVVSNAGPSDVIGAVVNDLIPAQITSWSWACTTVINASGCDTVVGSALDFTDTVDIQNGGSITYTVTANTASSATGNLSNTATVTASGYTGTTSDSATDTDAQNSIANLSITKTDNATHYAANGTKTYIITVSNTGPSDVTGAIVSDLIPAQIASWSWACTTVTGASGCDASPANAMDFTDTVNIQSGGSITYTVTATISAAPAGDLVNTATVSSPISAVASATDTDILITADPPPLEIGTNPDGTVYNLPVGSALTLSINLVADGDAGYDLVYYELPNGSGIRLDWVIIEISDGSNWYTIFNWGDNLADTNTNVDFNFLPPPPSPPFPPPEEPDQRDIPSANLYPFPGTGVAIDVDGLGIPAGTYPYIRIFAPTGDVDNQLEIDAIEILP